jgi:electron transfer flavoprotein beta subunit
VAEVCVLISVGRHPASGRARRADRDARAVELGLRLAGPALRVVHAGPADEPALRDYLGMGVARLTVLAIRPGEDAAAALVAHLKAHPPGLILAGTRAEAGEGSGSVPYLVAEALNLPLIAAAAHLVLEAGGITVHQALPRGQRRALATPLPAVVTVDAAAPEPRSVAFARARRGALDVIETVHVPDRAPEGWVSAPARPRPRRLRGVVGGSAEDRLRAVTQIAGAGTGRLLRHAGAEAAAAAILDYAVAEGILAERDTDATGALR